MKPAFFVFMLLLAMAIGTLPLYAASTQDRMLDNTSHVAGNLILNTSNYGSINSIQYPRFGENSYEMLSKAAPWISAKRYRRDSEGRLLYWLHPNPTATLNQTVFEDDPLWTVDLKPVIDTLTTVGYDGDIDLYELLPAYNPLLPVHPLSPEDRVLLSVLGYPAPREFVFPDPEETYCYSIPQDTEFYPPGLETLSAYYYDFCPFGNTGERDFGAGRHLNDHYPLGLAVHQESYAWGLQSYTDFVVSKYIIYNTSFVDSLMDVAIAFFVDADICGPIDSDPAQDLSGYVKGDGFNFAYTRKVDSSSNQTTYILANKIMTSSFDVQRQCWYWHVGNGPDDKHARQLYPQYVPRWTANEKYWLSTGRNPGYTRFISLIPQGDETEYEQPAPNDTRFLNVLHAAQPTNTEPNPEGRFHLQPGTGFALYSIFFAGNSIADLKQKSQFIESFINGGFILNDILDATCIPYLYRAVAESPANIHLDWHSYQQPDLFVLNYKADDAPEDEWQVVNLPGDVNTYSLGDLSLGTNYLFKVGAVFEGQYLESAILEGYMDPTSNPEEPLPAIVQNLKSYPNPFNPNTNIVFQLNESSHTELAVFNTRGQKVKTLVNGFLSAGEHHRAWDGTSDQGRKMGSGLYIVRVKTSNGVSTCKILMLK